MSIQLNCKCGRYFQLDDDQAGRSIKCPACDGMIAIPALSEVSAQAADSYAGVQTAASPTNSWGKPQNRGGDYDYDAGAERPQRPTAIDPRFLRNQPQPASRGFGGINAGIGGGMLMMLLAVIWFFGALILADRIFLYPPILFVLGLIAVFKGLAKWAN